MAAGCNQPDLQVANEPVGDKTGFGARAEVSGVINGQWLLMQGQIAVQGETRGLDLLETERDDARGSNHSDPTHMAECEK